MVLLVERQLTAAVMVSGGCGAGAPRPAAKVDDLGGRREVHLAAIRAYRRAEVHVLAVHEVPLIEQPRGLGMAPPDEEAGGGHPIDFTHTSRLCLQRRGRRPPDEQFLAQFGERPDHPAERKLWLTVRVDDSRTGNGCAWQLAQRTDEPVDRAFGHDG